MQLKLRKQNPDGIVRVESSGKVKEVLYNDHDTISICFRGKNSSGIVDLTRNEVNQIIDLIKGRMDIEKNIKVFSAAEEKRVI